MSVLTYSITILMIYSVVFLFVYLDEMFCDLFLYKKTEYITIFKGALLGLSSSVVIFFVHLLGLTGIPDARFTIVLLSASVLGPVAGIVTGLIIFVVSTVLNYFEMYFLIAHLADSFVIGLFIYWIRNKTTLQHIVMNMIGGIVSLLFIDFTGTWFLQNELEQFSRFKSYTASVVGLVVMLSCMLSIVLLREKRRTFMINAQKERQTELIQMNQEISDLNERLIESEKKYRLVLEASNEGFIEYDHVTKMLNLSDRALEICDYLFSSKTTSLHNAFDILDDADALQLKTTFTQLKNSQDSMFTIQLKVKQRDDVYKHVLLKAMIVRENDQITGVIGSIVDVSEQVEKEEVINRLAYYDEITSLLNENAYIRDFDILLETKEEGTILFFNISGYLRLEVMGLAYQNMVRMHVGLILKRLFLQKKLYQLNEGLYCIIFHDVFTKKEVTQQFELLSMELSQPFHFKDINIPIQIHSIYFEYPLNHLDSEGYLSRAKSSLYQLQKNKDYELNHFDEHQHIKLVRNNIMENLITVGLEKKEFYVVFQPQIEKNQAEIHGFEALLRWNSREFGPVSPVEFIPIAEQSGSIVKIGHFVLKSVCDFITIYEKNHHKAIKVSINVSFLELVNPNFAIQFNEHVKDAMISPDQIALEITETAMSEYVDIVTINVKILRALGYEIHLDDFGTGYSSLNHIRTLKIDYLKIDKSFIDKIAVDETTLRVIESLITLSHNIGIKVIAEGVEEKEQIDVLTALDCDVFQGYYFSRPEKEATIFSSQFMSGFLSKGIA